MTGEANINRILEALSVTHRSGRFTVHCVPELTDADGIHAVVAEREGMAVVVTVEAARRRGWPVEFEAAWLTIEVHTGLEAVGVTAAVSNALAEWEIPCNVLAGYYHDHLLVPVQLVDQAIACIEQLRRSPVR
ncbi:MAG: ACT domain-containing protein [Acidimicrobiales bacterium]